MDEFAPIDTDGRRDEPAGMTLGDLAALVVGFALAFCIPWRYPPTGPVMWGGRTNHPAWFVALHGVDHGAKMSFLALVAVAISRRVRYGGPIRWSEVLAIWVTARTLARAIERLPGIAISMHVEPDGPGVWRSVRDEDAYWCWTRGMAFLFLASCWLAYRSRKVPQPWLRLACTAGIAIGYFGGVEGPAGIMYRRAIRCLGPIADTIGAELVYAYFLDIACSAPFGAVALLWLRSRMRPDETSPCSWTERAAVLAALLGSFAHIGITYYDVSRDTPFLGLVLEALAWAEWLLLSVWLSRVVGPAWSRWLGESYNSRLPSPTPPEA